jgi:hypothetical protein
MRLVLQRKLKSITTTIIITGFFKYDAGSLPPIQSLKKNSLRNWSLAGVKI